MKDSRHDGPLLVDRLIEVAVVSPDHVAAALLFAQFRLLFPVGVRAGMCEKRNLPCASPTNTRWPAPLQSTTGGPRNRSGFQLLDRIDNQLV